MNSDDAPKAVMPSTVRRKLATILAADVAGYSRLMSEHEEATLRTLDAYRGIMDRLIDRHGGRIANTAGDSVLAEFDSPVEAVRCAMAVQEALEAENGRAPAARRMRFRIGINVGDVMVKDGDLLGDSVNVAARLQALAPAGGVCVSGFVHDQVEGKLAFRFTPLGAQQVKHIARPVRVYRVEPPRRAGRLTAAGARPGKADRGTGGRADLLVLPLLLVAIVAGVVLMGGPSALSGRVAALLGTQPPAPDQEAPVSGAAVPPLPGRPPSPDDSPTPDQAGSSGATPAAPGGTIPDPTAAVPEVAALDLAALSTQVAAIAGGIGCADLGVGVDGAGRPAVVGFVPDAYWPTLMDIGATVPALAGARLDVLRVPDGLPACQVMSVLRAGALLPGGPDLATLDGRLALYDEDALGVRIGTGGRTDGYLTVVLVNPDGSIVNLLPNPFQPDNALAGAAGGEVLIGEAGQYRVGPPFGPTMLAMIWTPAPLFPTQRPLQEPASSFLPDLATALQAQQAAAQQTGAALPTARVLMLTTGAA